jgi:hypothetical protein
MMFVVAVAVFQLWRWSVRFVCEYAVYHTRSSKAMELTAISLSPAPELQPAGLFAPHPKAARRFLEFFTAQINNDGPAKPISMQLAVLPPGATPTGRPSWPASKPFSVMVYTFARIGAGFAGDPDQPLFQTAAGKAGVLRGKPLWQQDAYRIIQRRAAAAGIETKIGNHTFRATGITAYLKNGGTLEIAQQIANHESPRRIRFLSMRLRELRFDESGAVRRKCIIRTARPPGTPNKMVGSIVSDCPRNREGTYAATNKPVD